MRYILIFFLLFLSLNAENEKQKLTVGLGGYIQSQPYKGVDDFILPSPVIFYDDGLFYIRWSRAGIYFLGDKQDDFAWGFSITTQPRTYGYEKNEIKGMNERETTWEGGLAFSAKTDKAYIEIMALTDVLDRYDSWMIKTEIGYDLEAGDFSFYPSVIIGYQSDEFINYYYGVTAEEVVSSGHSKYTPNGGFQVGVQTYIKYPFTDAFSALVNVRADRIPNSAANSPLVDQSFIYSGLLSLIYKFEY